MYCGCLVTCALPINCIALVLLLWLGALFLVLFVSSVDVLREGGAASVLTWLLLFFPLIVFGYTS